MNALWTLSGDKITDWKGGFGGNFGGVKGADAICQAIGAATGHGNLTWRAMLCAVKGPDGKAVHAIERIGNGPWYDAHGRLISKDINGLLSHRPKGDAQAVADLTDECGVPISNLGNAHDTVTGCNQQGKLNDTDPQSTCLDWTSSEGQVGSGGGFPNGKVKCGHSFPRIKGTTTGKGAHWLSDHSLRGCGKGANLLNNGSGSGNCIGCTGGFGGLYCFAL